MHLLYARSATIGHEVRYAITLIKLTFLFTFQVRAGYTVNIYMYKTIEASVNTVAIPTTGKSCTLGFLPKIPFKLTQSIHVALQKSCNFD